MDKLTEAQIKALKKEHGSVYELEVEIEEGQEKAVCYLKKPSIPILSAASSFIDRDKFQYLEILLNGCWIKGDSRIKENEESKYTVMLHCDNLFEIKQASIKKL